MQLPETLKILPALGFVPEDAQGKDFDHLELDLGYLKLRAFRAMNSRFVDVVHCTGTYYDGNILSDVQIQLPPVGWSLDRIAAAIVWNLDRIENCEFQPLTDLPWISEARSNFELLPWVRERLAYEDRPKCQVKKEWLKIALKELEEIVNSTEEPVLVRIRFDGEALSFRLDRRLVIVPAEGKAWEVSYEITSDRFSIFPKRLYGSSLEICIRGKCLHIDRFQYLPLSEVNKTEG